MLRFEWANKRLTPIEMKAMYHLPMVCVWIKIVYGGNKVSETYENAACPTPGMRLRMSS